MKQISLIISLFIVVFAVPHAKSQDAVFSQFYASSLYLNPAFAGSNTNLSFSSNYRSQWKSIVLPYVTNQMSFVKPLYRDGLTETHIGGLGLSMYNDRAGDGNFKTLGININAAYNLQLTRNDEHIISFGIQGGIVQKNVDYTNLEWGEQYNPFIGFDATHIPGETQLGQNRIYPDIAAGAVYYYNIQEEFNAKKISAFAGVSAYHMNQPDESFVQDMESKLPVSIKAHGGVKYVLNRKMRLSPNVLFLTQNEVYQMNLGMYWNYRVLNSANELFKKTDLIVGAWYRYGDAFIASVGLHNKIYTLGFSYDYNTSSLRFATRGRGAWEVSLTLRKVENRKPKHFATPRI